MADIRMLFSMVDALPPDDLEQLYQYIRQRRQVVLLRTATGTHPAVAETTQREPAETIREEVNAVIDDALNVVQRKRASQVIAKQQS